MIPLSDIDLQRPLWQNLLNKGINSVSELLSRLNISPEQVPEALLDSQAFPLRIPEGYLARMRQGDIHDPLLRQVLPVKQELIEVAGFIPDPLQENAVNPIPGLLHKYHGRVLLTLTGSCAIHCRYCFRRHFPYEQNNPGRPGWLKAFEYIANDPSISEVILSGGDPLVLNDDYLSWIGDHLAQIKHVKTLRIHSRIPVVLPERLTPEFLNWFGHLPLRPILVIHSSHPNEIDEAVTQALVSAKRQGISLLNQTVILKNINDSAEILIDLSEKLFSAQVLPYYLHLPDPVAGNSHFHVEESDAKLIIKTMLSRLPGYLVPKLVKEISGENSKIPC